MNQSTACPGESPFFIVGNPRSGTTLLTFILSSHPRIHIPGETGFLPQLTKYNQGQLTPEQVAEIIRTITRLNRKWRGVVTDEKEFYDALPSHSLACVLDCLYRLQTQKFNVERWGDKTPSYVRYIPQIANIFPNAQFIHIIRDGRDSALSAQKRWGTKKWYMDNYYLLKNWEANVQAGRRAGKNLPPSRYLEIKYEDLVQKPREIIEQVCNFLNETFHEDMLEHSKLAQKVITPAGHTEVLRPINTRSLERWREEMTPFDNKLANALIGQTLQTFDYPLADSDSLTALERIKLLILGIRYQILNLIRVTLYNTGFLTLNRGKQQMKRNNPFR
ncbi:MAG: sulfotransferase [Candidatus Promineifilaceae bacterium]